MTYSDDDTNLPLVSNQDYFTRADHGKKDALRKAVEEQEGKKISEQKTELKADLSLKQLKQTIAGKADEEEKRKEKEEERHDQSKGFGTKTHKQLEEEAVQTAMDGQTPEKMMEKEKKKEEIQDQTSEEYQQQIG